MTTTRVALAAVCITLLAAGASAQAPADSPATQEPGPATPPAAGPMQAPSPPVSTAPAALPDPSARVFGSPAGLLLSSVRADAIDDFELVLDRVGQALRISADPVRRQQAEGWRFFRATEAGPNGSVLYVFVVDPVIPGADYGVARLLAEAFPDEVGQLYELYDGSFAAGQTMLNLEAVQLLAVPAGRAPGAEAAGGDPTIIRPGQPLDR